jgi:pseudouridylate synthase
LNDFNATLELNRVEQAMKEDDERYYRLVAAQLSGGARSLSNMVSGFDTDVAGSGSDRDHLSQQSKLNNGVYLLRAVQRAGLCSRRAALLVVSGGKVKVDGKVELNPFRPVFASNDIHVEGHQQRLRFGPTRLWLLNKPANVYTSGNTDKKERKMYMEYAAALGHEHLIPVGSLPYRSNGALLLTNDGELSRFLEHPSSRVQSTYTYRVTPAIDPVLAHKWNTEGVMIDGVVHKEFEFVVFTQRHSKYAVKVKVRSSSIPVHQVLQHVGRRIIRGGRTSIGPYGLQGMFPGHIREVVVPPYFVRHISDVWRPFIERDWPYFRKIRLEKLKAAVNYRILTKREREELDAFTYDQLMDTLKQDHSALVEESRQYSRALRSRPSIEAEGGEVAPPDGMSPESEVDVRSF